MFSRFNTQAHPLEAKSPRVITKDHLKTMYVHHLKSLMSTQDVHDLDKEITEGERDAARKGEAPRTRHEIHELALCRDREKVVAAAKLRAARLTPIPKPSIKDRFGDLKNKGKARNPPPHPSAKRGERERRHYNNCGVRDHLIKDFPEAIHDGNSDGNNPDLEPAPFGTKPTPPLPPLSPLPLTRGGREVIEVVEVPQEEAEVEGVVVTEKSTLRIHT